MSQPESFKDYFSGHADIYAKHRPVYPLELFTHLSTLTEEHTLAWDCGTGNGQCAIQLTNCYTQVFASDPSAEQIRNAIPNSKVLYRVEKAEHSSLEDNSVDLITIAQALHWFDHPRFYAEVNRVLKPGGVIAAIAYINPVVSAEITALTDQLHDVILKEYWKPENRLVEARYETIPFPFDAVPVPEFTLQRNLTREEFMGHLRTWSAVQRFIDTNKTNPLTAFEEQLALLWNDTERKLTTWPLILKVGRKVQAV